MKKSLLLAIAAAASCAASAALPTTTGWYKIQYLSGASSAPTETELINCDVEHIQDGTKGYALYYGTTDENKPAKSFIHITVSGNTYKFSSINGHGVQDNATSSRNWVPGATPLTASGDNVEIGDWSTYPVEAEGMTYVGKSSNASLIFSITPVEDAVLESYDIWTVSIALPAATAISNDVKISYDSENNKGIAAVYHGGKFFVTKGTPISKDDLTLINCDRNYEMTIDNEAHTIIVTEPSAVATGKYIRIGAKTAGYYYDMVAGGNPRFSQDTNTAIYYYDANKRLVHYGEGRAAKATDTGNNRHQLGGSTSAAENADLNTNAPEINFIKCEPNKPENAALSGRFYVTWDYDIITWALLYCNSDGTVNKGTKSKSDVNGLTNANWTFSIEDVTELPVKIGADGKGTMIVPVAVTVPASDNFTFYTASTNAEDKLIFSTVEAGTTIPANTNIVIKRASTCTDETCNVTIATNAAEAAVALAETSERFIGSYLATTAPAPAEGEVIYVKSSTLGESETAGENDVVFSKVAEGDVIPAGALAFKAKKNSDAEAPATLTLSLTAENPGTTTAINSIFVENEPANGAIYDLQGRRLSAPVKGINIIGGRKVLVK